MTRRLLLMRHGSAASPPGSYDRERPLTNRGRGQALLAGDTIRTRTVALDRIVLSPATRVQETWEAFLLGLAASPEADLESKVETDSRVYDNTVDDVLDALRETPDDVDGLLVIGHNPSIAGLASVLDEDPDNLVRAELAGGFPTATVAFFDVEGPWAELREGGARLTEVVARQP